MCRRSRRSSTCSRCSTRRGSGCSAARTTSSTSPASAARSAISTSTSTRSTACATAPSGCRPSAPMARASRGWSPSSSLPASGANKFATRCDGASMRRSCRDASSPSTPCRARPRASSRRRASPSSPNGTTRHEHRRDEASRRCRGPSGVRRSLSRPPHPARRRPGRRSARSRIQRAVVAGIDRQGTAARRREIHGAGSAGRAARDRLQRERIGPWISGARGDASCRERPVRRGPRGGLPMKSDSGAAATGWAGQRERSNLPVLRFMRWCALAAGRRASRLLLHPAVLYFLLTSADLRRHSRRYLDRALGRHATSSDLYRHVFAFAATVLDRVYLLQERFDEFDVGVRGVEPVLEQLGQGIGVLACGAHVGSFEALRMIGHDKGLRVAMIMYEDNARLLNDTLAAIAPRAELRTIALGRVDAMLAIRQWLDEGGVAGLLADRSLPGNAQRSKAVALDFLGAPALFPDGPFRLAAMLRRKVVFMAGLYRGGRDYDLRFVELADFSTLRGAGAAAAADRDAAILAAMQRYVATLEALCREAPHNWFNFYDFWADADLSLIHISEPTRRTPISYAVFCL